MSRTIDRCLVAVAASLVTWVAVRSGTLESNESPATSLRSAATANANPATNPATDPAAGDPSSGQPLPSAGGQAPAPPSTAASNGPRAEFAAVRFGPLTEEEIDRCLTVAEAIDPNQAQALRDLRLLSEQKFLDGLRSSPRLRSLARLMREDPNAYNLKLVELRNRKVVAELSAQLQTAVARGDSPEAIDALATRLRPVLLLQEAFLYRARRAEADALKRQLVELEAALSDDLLTVDERVDRLVRDLIDKATPAQDAAGSGAHSDSGAGPGPGSSSGTAPTIASPAPRASGSPGG
ncbi:MAG: hypothetical protein AB8G96_14020 [Phycisphaerales bacterium]